MTRIDDLVDSAGSGSPASTWPRKTRTPDMPMECIRCARARLVMGLVLMLAAPPLSKVGGATPWYLRDIRVARDGRYGVGADVTFYYVAPNLRDNYGTGPVSYHIFF